MIDRTMKIRQKLNPLKFKFESWFEDFIELCDYLKLKKPSKVFVIASCWLGYKNWEETKQKRQKITKMQANWENESMLKITIEDDTTVYGRTLAVCTFTGM